MARLFRIEIDTGAAAFAEDGADEIARILRHVARHLEDGHDMPKALRDENGNRCGVAEFVEIGEDRAS